VLDTDLLSCWPNVAEVPPMGTSISHGTDIRARSMHSTLDNARFAFVFVWVKYAYWIIGFMAGKVLEALSCCDFC